MWTWKFSKNVPEYQNDSKFARWSILTYPFVCFLFKTWVTIKMTVNPVFLKINCLRLYFCVIEFLIWSIFFSQSCKIVQFWAYRESVCVRLKTDKKKMVIFRIARKCVVYKKYEKLMSHREVISPLVGVHNPGSPFFVFLSLFLVEHVSYQ